MSLSAAQAFRKESTSSVSRRPSLFMSPGQISMKVTVPGLTPWRIVPPSVISAMTQ